MSEKKDDESRREFEEFIRTECAEAIQVLVNTVELLFPNDHRKQGCALLAASEYFKFKHGPKVS